MIEIKYSLKDMIRCSEIRKGESDVEIDFVQGETHHYHEGSDDDQVDESRQRGKTKKCHFFVTLHRQQSV